MLRSNLETYIAAQYGVVGNHPWAKYPDYVVFRHESNRKWFALLMEVPAKKLGLPPAESSPAELTILNVKCDPLLIGSLREEPGFFPAYHMNKGSWVSLDLSRVPEEKIRWLLDLSYEMTAAKDKNPRSAGKEPRTP